MMEDELGCTESLAEKLKIEENPHLSSCVSQLSAKAINLILRIHTC